MSVRRAIAAAVVALALPAAAAAAPVYRGSAHGVTCVLRASSLTMTFGPGADALLRRAAESPHTMEFLMWTTPAPGTASGRATSWFAGSVTVDVHKRQARMGLMDLPKGTGFRCGLHAPVKTTKGPDRASTYLTNPIVLIRLTRAG
ncbi:MAG TPA: hypothetical protein VMJ49_11025 [Gaiellaceae bacterium]|nr:hypothetical protein [Gaiellaceae bacterium]